jgi:pilus assembly protein CpaB
MITLGGNLRRLMPMGGAVIAALVAVVLIKNYLAEERRELEAERRKVMANYQDPIELAVAAKDLPEGTKLEPSHLQMGAIPEKFAQPYSVRSIDELVGKVTLAPIAEGEQILTNKLRRPDEAPPGSTLSGLTPKGRRAVTIIVDATTGTEHFVQPGDAVDVLWTVKLPQAGQQDGQLVTLTLFQNVAVLAVGGRTVAQRMAPAQPAEGGSPSAYTVTLAMTPQEAPFLLFARDQGRIQLSVRPRAEAEAQVSVAPANVNTFNAFLESQLGIKTAQQSAAPNPIRQVEIYKGLQRDVVALSELEPRE